MHTFFAQRAKNGDLTVSTANTILNTYSYLTADASSGSTSITVNNTAFSGGSFSGTLSSGDLILIIQMQGATIDVDVTPTASWGGHYTRPNNVSNWKLSADLWGQILNYNNAGNFEYAEVQSVQGVSKINLQCALSKNYTASGHVQIVRVPRINNLTVSGPGSITAPAWNGQYGGIVAVEVNGDLILNAGTKISVSGLGFRGGVADNQGGTSSSVSTGDAAAGTGNGETFLGSDQGVEGARKGEGIAGYTTEYAALYSTYGRSAPANGGGGAGYQNAGGGGGANIGSGTYTGKGVPNSAYTAIFNLEKLGFGGSTSAGGGRGGYTLSSVDKDETLVGPNNSLWGGGYRKVEGGLGGHPLLYDPNKIFFGGGGGAGDQDNLQGGSGGNGGGIIFLTIYGSFSGAGSIETNGNDGSKSNPTNATPNIGQKKGTDGAGGAGAGGAVYIQNSSPIPSTISINAKGGKGGDNALTLGLGAVNTEANGPGGGGAGGSVSITTGTPVINVNGGLSGTVTVGGLTTASTVKNFPPNGATDGAIGVGNLTTTFIDLIVKNDTICANNSTTLTATLVGNGPSNAVYWYTQQSGGTSIATGLTFTTPVLNTTTTYYVGFCPGTFRIPVKVVVNPNPVLAGAINITHATCSGSGAITGLAVTGGTLPYTYKWSNNMSTIDILNVSAGNYTIEVADSNKCKVNGGPYTINSIGGPVIDSSQMIIANTSCNSNGGAITGIVAQGNGLTYSWSNNAGSNLDATNLSPGFYKLTITDIGNCSKTVGPIKIASTDGPKLDSTHIVVSTSTCGNTDGSVKGITATGVGLHYFWDNKQAQTADTIGLSAGLHTITVVDNNQCKDSLTNIKIATTSGISLDISNIKLINEHCGKSDGSITNIKLNGGLAPYHYTWTNFTGDSLDIHNLKAGSYQLTVQDANLCSTKSAIFTISNLAGPSIDSSALTLQNVTCNLHDGSISNLIVTPTNCTYKWSGTSQTTIDIANLDAGSYVLTATDQFGCEVISNVIHINGPNFIKIDTSLLKVTKPDCFAMNGSIQGIIVSGGHNPTYSWNNLFNTLDITGLTVGAFKLIVSDDQHCKDSLLIQIQTKPNPIIDLNSMVVTDDHCSQHNGSITGISIKGGTPAYHYFWDTDTTNHNLNRTNLSPGTYVLHVIDQAGCMTQSSITVANIQGVKIDTTNISLVNPSCFNFGEIKGLIINSPSNYTLSWSNGSPNLDQSSLLAGNYRLIVTDSYGCKDSTRVFHFRLNQQTKAQFTYSPASPQFGEAVIVDNNSINASNYVWKINDSIVSSDQNYSFVNESYDDQLKLTLIASTNFGCSDTLIELISLTPPIIYYVPNSFTPNNDLINNTFKATLLDGINLDEFNLKIYTRWGELVFDTNNPSTGWDGKLNGELMPIGTYTWLLKFKEIEYDKPHELIGTVNLIR